MTLREEILYLNRERSRFFCLQASQDALRLYTAQHPTKVIVFKCMDGRVNLPLITGIPMGKLHPFRNIGGIFTLGDPYLGRLVLDAKDGAIAEGRAMLALCTYHFSSGDGHRGCAGHNYDTDAAKRGAFSLKHEFKEVFGHDNPAITAIVVGIETDEDILIFHNGGGEELNIADHLNASDDELLFKLKTLYPRMANAILRDILPLAVGNRDHVKKIRGEGRPIASLIHNENIIAVGRGFDWLHLINRALIIGPYGYNDRTWREAVRVAGNIVLNNFKGNSELQKGGSLLFVSAPYHDAGEYHLARLKARHFRDVSLTMLQEISEALKLDVLVGVTNMQTMRFHELDEKMDE